MFPFPGPTVPPFRTFLVEGTYHPSAPIHLCLSHTKLQHHDAKAILISPSRRSLTLALQEYNDDWLTSNAGHGGTSHVASRIKVFYPPSPTHLALLLSMFRISQPSDGPSFDAKTTFDVVPALIVLHELSSYFLQDDNEQPHTVSSYLTLITHTLAALSFLRASGSGTPTTAFALFDSQLDRLKLPVLRTPLETRQDRNEDESDPSDTESVSLLAQKYFEYRMVFENVEDSPPHGVNLKRRKRMRLYRSVQEKYVGSWEWSEIRTERRGSEKESTTFVWT